MPYNPNQPQGRGMPMQHDEEKHHMNMEEKKNHLRELLDDICTYLYSGVHYHQKAANCFRLLSCRGFGRLHEHMSKLEFCELQELEKLCVDKLWHLPHVDMGKVTKAEEWEIKDLNGLKPFFDDWMKRESIYEECINEAINYARKIDMEIYGKLVCIADRYQEEVFRAHLLKNRLALAGWSGADLALVNQIIHDYYEHGKIDPRKPMDYNLG